MRAIQKTHGFRAGGISNSSSPFSARVRALAFSGFVVKTSFRARLQYRQLRSLAMVEIVCYVKKEKQGLFPRLLASCGQVSMPSSNFNKTYSIWNRQLGSGIFNFNSFLLYNEMVFNAVNSLEKYKNCLLNHACQNIKFNINFPEQCCVAKFLSFFIYIF